MDFLLHTHSLAGTFFYINTAWQWQEKHSIEVHSKDINNLSFNELCLCFLMDNHCDGLKLMLE